MNNDVTYDFMINGTKKTLSFAPDATLLRVLRDAGYTEVHNGCETGECGSCVVILDGKTVNSCMVLAASAQGGEITTVRALGDVHNPHPIQRAFAGKRRGPMRFLHPGADPERPTCS